MDNSNVMSRRTKHGEFIKAHWEKAAQVGKSIRVSLADSIAYRHAFRCEQLKMDQLGSISSTDERISIITKSEKES